jgi:RHS repeat-associated protein
MRRGVVERGRRGFWRPFVCALSSCGFWLPGLPYVPIRGGSRLASCRGSFVAGARGTLHVPAVGGRRLRLCVLAVAVVVGAVAAPLGSARTDVAGRVASCGSTPSCVISVSAVKMIDSTDGPQYDPPRLGGTAVFMVKLSPMLPDSCSVIDVSLSVSGVNTATGPSNHTQTKTLLPASYGPDQGYAYLVSYVGANPGIDTATVTVTAFECTNFGPYSFNTAGQESYSKTFSVGWGYNFRDNGVCDNPPAQAFHNEWFRRAYHFACVDDPIAAGMGSFQTAVTDATLRSGAQPFAFRRVYNSNGIRGLDLGYNWTDPFSAYLTTDSNVTKATVRAGTGQDLLFTKQADGSWLPPAWASAKLTKSGSVFTLEQADHTKLVFSLGTGTTYLLSAIKDRNDQTLTVTNAVNYMPCVSSVTTSNGKTITFTHDASFRLTQMKLPDNRTVGYTYNAAGDLASATDLGGGTTTYTYDAYHRLTKVTDPLGHATVTNEYGSGNRVTAQTDALGNTTHYDWAPATPPTETTAKLTVTDPRGNTWVDRYSPDGLLVSRTDPLGHTTSYTWDGATSDPLSYTDARGNITSFQYDNAHHGTTLTLPGGNSTSATYNSGGDITAATDALGHTSTFGYDPHLNPTTLTQPDGHSIQLAYDARGLVTGITNRAAKTTNLTYDTLGNRTSATSPLGNKTTYGYDANARLTSIVDPRGNATGGVPDDHKTTIAYDAADNVTSVTDPLGHATTYTYDAAGNLTAVTDAKNHQTQYQYDAANRLTKITRADGTFTTLAYDLVGNLTSRTDANGHTTTYTYDTANRLTTIVDPLNRTWTLGYDADGDLTSVTKPSGGTISYGYDALGRRTSIGYSDGTSSVSFGFDAAGNRTSMTDGEGTSTYTYDVLNRLTEVSRGSSSFTYSYDLNSHVTSRSYPDGTATTYTFDDDANMTSATSADKTTSYSYNPNSELTRIELPNSVVLSRAYDAAGHVTQLGDGFRPFAYTYDAADNVASKTIDGATQTYTYDSLDRLTDVAGALTLHYGYDAVGNRTSEQDSSGQTTYSYDAGDELTSSTGPGGSATYGHDANGNQTTSGAWTYSFNLAGQLASATDGATSVSYTHDGDGNRTTATAAGTTTRFAWDSNFALPQLALEQDSSGGLIRRYLYGNGRISMTTPQMTAYYSSDAVGTVTDLSSGDGSLAGRYDSRPFGDAQTSSQLDPTVAENPFDFAGEYKDPTTGLINLRARQYGPARGRFVSPDPLGSQAGNGPYVYAGNNPLRYTDPGGLMFGDSCGSVGCWLMAPGRDFGVHLAKLSFGCVSGIWTGTSAIASPFGYLVATALSPEVAVALPAAGCAAGLTAAVVEIEVGYAGPDPLRPPAPLGG